MPDRELEFQGKTARYTDEEQAVMRDALETLGDEPLAELDGLTERENFGRLVHELKALDPEGSLEPPPRRRIWQAGGWRP